MGRKGFFAFLKTLLARAEFRTGHEKMREREENEPREDRRSERASEERKESFEQSRNSVSSPFLPLRGRNIVFGALVKRKEGGGSAWTVVEKGRRCVPKRMDRLLLLLSLSLLSLALFLLEPPIAIY